MAAVAVDSSPRDVLVHDVRARRRENRSGWAFMAPFGILFFLVFIVPIGWAIYSSFFREIKQGGTLGAGSKTLNAFVGLENFQWVVTSERFWSGIGRVLVYTLIQVPVMIIAALALAMLLDSFIVKRVTVFRLGFFLPYAIPGVVAALIWLFLYTNELSPISKGLAAIGLTPSFFSSNVILASMANITTWTFTGYNMLIFLAALQAIPHDLYEAARIDGANGFQVAMKIKLPNVRGAALLAMLLSIVGTIQLFNEPTVLKVGAPDVVTNEYTPMMMAIAVWNGTAQGGFRGNGPSSAVAIVMAFIAGVLACIYALVERKVNE